MRNTLLEMVQSILSDMDSENVNSISDSVEAQQVASVIEDTFFNIIAAREIPEHKQLLKLTALADSTRPTHFQYPTDTKQLERVFYDISTTGTNYREIYFVEPLDFLNKVNEDGSNVTSVLDKNGGTKIFIRTDRAPSYYTSFDDNYIVFDSYDSSVESTLQESKTRAYGTVYPSFTQADTFQPDLDDTMLPYLLAESKSVCFSLFKGGSDPKIEQASRRLKSYVQNDQFKTKKANTRTHYGRN
tara:strand:+ start:2978 stop:3709 length:732 start_codon:yes stop_codon:yes gene_type:complete